MVGPGVEWATWGRFGRIGGSASGGFQAVQANSRIVAILVPGVLLGGMVQERGWMEPQFDANVTAAREGVRKVPLR